jgi:hypothetical protein
MDQGYDIKAMQERDRRIIIKAFEASSKPANGGPGTGVGAGGSESLLVFDRKAFERKMSSAESSNDRKLSEMIAVMSSEIGYAHHGAAARVGRDARPMLSPLKEVTYLSLDEAQKSYELALRNLEFTQHTEWADMKLRHAKEMMKLSQACMDRTWTYPLMDALLFDEKERYLGEVRFYGESEDLMPEV